MLNGLHGRKLDTISKGDTILNLQDESNRELGLSSKINPSQVPNPSLQQKT